MWDMGKKKNTSQRKRRRVNQPIEKVVSPSHPPPPKIVVGITRMVFHDKTCFEAYQSRFYKCSITCEKKIAVTDEKCPRFTECFVDVGWFGNLLKGEGKIYRMLVREFYTNIHRVDDKNGSFHTLVNNKEIFVDRTVVTRACGLEDFPFNDQFVLVDGNRKGYTDVKLREITKILSGQPEVFTGDYYFGDKVPMYVRHFAKIIGYNLIPGTSNSTSVPREAAELLSCIVAKKPLHMGHFIVHTMIQIHKKARNKTLGYAQLIPKILDICNVQIPDYAVELAVLPLPLRNANLSRSKTFLDKSGVLAQGEDNDPIVDDNDSSPENPEVGGVSGAAAHGDDASPTVTEIGGSSTAAPGVTMTSSQFDLLRQEQLDLHRKLDQVIASQSSQGQLIDAPTVTEIGGTSTAPPGFTMTPSQIDLRRQGQLDLHRKLDQVIATQSSQRIDQVIATQSSQSQDEETSTDEELQVLKRQKMVSDAPTQVGLGSSVGSGSLGIEVSSDSDPIQRVIGKAHSVPDQENSVENGSGPWFEKLEGETESSRTGGWKDLIDIGNFPVLGKFAALYRQIWQSHGHLATHSVIKMSTFILVVAVSELLEAITVMATVKRSELDASLLAKWDRQITCVEVLQFNVGWLRKHFNEVRMTLGDASSVINSKETHEKARNLALQKQSVLHAKRDALKVQLAEVEKDLEQVTLEVIQHDHAVSEDLAARERHMSFLQKTFLQDAV